MGEYVVDIHHRPYSGNKYLYMYYCIYIYIGVHGIHCIPSTSMVYIP